MSVYILNTSFISKRLHQQNPVLLILLFTRMLYRPMKYITFESLSKIKTVPCLFFSMLNLDANHSTVCIIDVRHV